MHRDVFLEIILLIQTVSPCNQSRRRPAQKCSRRRMQRAPATSFHVNTTGDSLRALVSGRAGNLATLLGGSALAAQAAIRQNTAWHSRCSSFMLSKIIVTSICNICHSNHGLGDFHFHYKIMSCRHHFIRLGLTRPFHDLCWLMLGYFVPTA
jgi:hypothetical protein